MTTKKITSMNEGLEVSDIGCMLKSIKFYSENGRVLVWAETGEGADRHEGLQYLSPQEAMSFAKAMEASAIEALKNDC